MGPIATFVDVLPSPPRTFEREQQTSTVQNVHPGRSIRPLPTVIDSCISDAQLKLVYNGVCHPPRFVVSQLTACTVFSSTFNFRLADIAYRLVVEQVSLSWLISVPRDDARELLQTAQLARGQLQPTVK